MGLGDPLIVLNYQQGSGTKYDTIAINVPSIGHSLTFTAYDIYKGDATGGKVVVHVGGIKVRRLEQEHRIDGIEGPVSFYASLTTEGGFEILSDEMQVKPLPKMKKASIAPAVQKESKQAKPQVYVPAAPEQSNEVSLPSDLEEQVETSFIEGVATAIGDTYQQLKEYNARTSLEVSPVDLLLIGTSVIAAYVLGKRRQRSLMKRHQLRLPRDL